MSIAQSLLDIVLDEAGRHGVEKVKVIRLQVGDLAAIVPESLSFCFEMLSEGTVAAGSEIEIERIPVVARCPECDVRFEVEQNIFLCPKCSGPTLELVSGRELSILNIEGETGEPDGAD
jgi:hydrogenase nickel incorporation protein HypA/HybF